MAPYYDTGKEQGTVLSLLGISTLFRDFRKSLKMCKMNHFSLFCKSCLILFLTFIIRPVNRGLTGGAKPPCKVCHTPWKIVLGIVKLLDIA